MADQLYLSLWFPNFRLTALAPALVSVLRELRASGGATAVTAAAAYPISWHETPVYARVYDPEEAEFAAPEHAVVEALELLHDDFAYEFEVKWDLWIPEAGGDQAADEIPDVLWREEPRTVRVVGYGPEFDEGAYEQNGHIRVDFGTDTPFLLEDVALDREAALHVQQNVQKLIDFTNAVQKNAGISSRLLWSESGESLAEKLIARLQHVQ